MKADFMLKLYLSSGGTTVFQDQYIVSYYTIGNALVTNVGDNFRFTSRPQGFSGIPWGSLRIPGIIIRFPGDLF